jgi:hypothetical protein
MASGMRGSWTTVHNENLATYTTALLDLLNTHRHFNILLGNGNSSDYQGDNSYLQAGLIQDDGEAMASMQGRRR